MSNLPSNKDYRYHETDTDSNKLSLKTSEILEQLSFAKNPVNYSLIYEMVAKIDPDFSKQIEETINEGEFNEESARILFSFLWSKMIRENLPTEEVSEILREISHIINNWLSNSNDNLDQISNHIETLAEEKDCDVILESIQQNILPILKAAYQEAESLKSNMAHVNNEVSHLKRELDRATSIAKTDELTNIPNRRGFNHFIQKTIDNANESQTTFALLIIDIDHFKKVNDSFGHLVGDSVLRYLAKTLSQETKGKDYIARIGGEEFVIVLPDTHYDDAFSLAVQIQKKVASKPLHVKGSHKPLKLTISIGVAIHQLGETLDSLFHRADKGLYLAKNSGRNRVCGEYEL